LIWRFLNSLNRKNDELPCLGIAIQPLESPALRNYIGAPSGVLVNWTRNPAIQLNDVICSVKGHAVDNQGLTMYLGRRIHFAAVLHDLFSGDSVDLTVLRNKGEISVTANLVPSSSVDLVQNLQYSRRPEYVVVGGLVFQPLSHDFLQGWNERDRPSHLQDLLNRGRIEGSKSQAIILTNVLAARCNAGYSSGWVGGPVLKALNGEEVQNVRHLADNIDRIMKSESEEFLKFTVSGYVDDHLIVMHKLDVLRDEPSIQKTYEIPRIRSF